MCDAPEHATVATDKSQLAGLNSASTNARAGKHVKFVADFLTSLAYVFSVAKRMRRGLPIRTDFVATRMASSNLASAYELLVPVVRREIASEEEPKVESASEIREPSQKGRRVRR